MEEFDVFGFLYLGSGRDGLLVYGDYVGSGDIGEANIRAIENAAEEDDLSIGHISYRQWADWTSSHPWLREDFEGYLDDDGQPPDIFFAAGGHGAHEAYVRIPPEHYGEDEPDPHEDLRNLVRQVRRLEDYSILDDDILGEVGMEREDQMWDGWLSDELSRGLPGHLWREAVGYRHPEKRDAIGTRPQAVDLWEAYRWAREVTNTDVVQEANGAWVDSDAIKDHVFYNAVEQMTGIPAPMSAYLTGGYYYEKAPEGSPFDVDEWREQVEDWIRKKLEEIEDGDLTWSWLQEDLAEEYARLQNEKS